MQSKEFHCGVLRQAIALVIPSFSFVVGKPNTGELNPDLLSPASTRTRKASLPFLCWRRLQQVIAVDLGKNLFSGTET